MPNYSDPINKIAEELKTFITTNDVMRQMGVTAQDIDEALNCVTFITARKMEVSFAREGILREDYRVWKFRSADKEYTARYQSALDTWSLRVTSIMGCTNFEPTTAHLRIPHTEDEFSDDPLVILDVVRSSVKLKLNDRFKEDKWRNFIDEVIDSITKETLSYAYRKRWNEKILAEMQETGKQNFYSYLENFDSVAEQNLFMESWGLIGHPTHPCPKTKIGMSLEEFVRVGPEFAQTIQVPIIAIHRDNLQVLKATHETFALFMLEHLTTFSEWRESIANQGLEPNEYIPMPVHPWQLQHDVRERFAPLYESKRIVETDAHILARAGSSGRTMVPVDGEGKALTDVHLFKLPLGIQMTSVRRILSPRIIYNESSISSLIRAITEEWGPDCLAGMRVANDVGGWAVNGEGITENDASNLSILLRERLINELDQGSVITMVGALFAKVPGGEHSVIHDFMRHAGVDSVEKAADYFKEYCDIVVSEQFNLMGFGIGLLAHGQNAVAVFKNGRLAHTIARDMGGARIDMSILQSIYGVALDLFQKSDKAVEFNRDDFREQFTHATLNSHLIPMAGLIAKEFGGREIDFHDIIARSICRNAKIFNSTTPANLVREDVEKFLITPHNTRCFMTMRVCDNQGRIFEKTPNLLAVTPCALEYQQRGRSFRELIRGQDRDDYQIHL